MLRSDSIFLGMAVFVAGGTLASGGTNEITYARHVAPLLQKHCQDCHRPSQIAPMSLLTYEETRPWAESIRENVVVGIMPPWHADPRYGSFANDRRLTKEEIDTIVAWVDAGAPRGDLSDLPPPREFAEGWAIGKPDLVLTMQEEYELGAEGPDQYIYFAIPTNFTEDRYIEAVEVQPGNRSIVHHVLAYVQPGGTGVLSRANTDRYNEGLGVPMFFGEGHAIRVLPDAPVHDDACALPDGGSALSMDMTSGRRRLLTGFAPGARGDLWTEGLGKLVPAGSEILFQVHYNRTGKVERDRSSIGFVFAKEPPQKVVEAYWVSNYYFRIPPGAADHEVTGCYTFDKDVEILSYFPHMHFRGKDMMIRAIYPSGETEILFNVPGYDFSWQTTYLLNERKWIPGGTKILVTAHFDNSKGNSFNPDPAKTVRWGDPTYDEMMIGGIDYVVASPKATTESPEIP